MPLTKPLPELQRELRDLLAESTAAAIQRLQAELPENSPKQDELFLLSSRLDAARKLQGQGTARFDDILIIENQVRRDLLALVNALTPTDFDPPKTAVTAARQGHLLYRIPHQMPLGEPTQCVVRIALDPDLVREDFDVDEHTVLKTLKKYSKTMLVELFDPSGGRNFDIRSLNKYETQTIDFDAVEPTQWRFEVVPRREGQFTLEVRVVVIELVDGEKEMRERILEEQVQIFAEGAMPREAAKPEKKAGQALAFAQDFPKNQAPAGPSSQSAPSSRPEYDLGRSTEVPRRSNQSTSKSLRTMALFLAFLVASTATTWAVTPADTRDFWLARVQNSEAAYTDFLAEHPTSEKREKALARRAVVTEKPELVQAYLREFPAEKADPELHVAVVEKLERLETAQLEIVRKNPEPQNFQRFVADFPETERLPELVQLAEARPETRAETLPALEQAAVEQLKTAPTTARVRQFTQIFPQSQRLPEVKYIVLAAPKISEGEKTTAVETLGEARAKQVDQEPTKQKLVALVQDFRESRRAVAEAKRIAEQHPQVGRQAMPEIRKAEAWQRAQPAKAEPAPAPKPSETPENQPPAPGKVGEVKQPATISPAPETPKPAETKKEEGLPAKKEVDHNVRSGLEMVHVEGGTFTMGSNDGESDEKPPHQVTLSSFSIGKYEVTQADWRDIMGSDPPGLRFKGCDQCPVENISWNDIQDFLKKLNAQKGGKKYRLPTEAEWEFAARGGNKSGGFEYAGSKSLGEVAWYGSNSDSKTHPVGQKKANELGLFDMSGNVYEWCADWYDSYSSGSQTNPTGAGTGASRVDCGGSWNGYAENCRAANRYFNSPDYRDSGLGFRLARSF